MDLLIPDSGLLFWMVIAFGTVFVVLWRFGWPIITTMIDNRKAYIDQSLAAAREANEKLAQIQEEGAALLKQAREEQSRILSEAVATRNKILDEAKDEAAVLGEKLMHDARLQIAKEKEDALRDIRRTVAMLSVEISEKVVRSRLSDDKEQMAMIDRLLDEVVEQR